jgi:hypothetical protein
MASKREWYRYDYKVGNTIRHSGITTDPERREGEHQRRWPGGHLVIQGPKVTEETAREWEDGKYKAMTSPRER